MSKSFNIYHKKHGVAACTEEQFAEFSALGWSKDPSKEAEESQAKAAGVKVDKEARAKAKAAVAAARKA